MKKDEELDDNYVENTLLLHLGAFILSNSKKTRINFDREINRFYNNNIYFSDTDSLYIENK